MNSPLLAEQQRLADSEARAKHWKRWGPYLADRAWGTVREDYSENGTAWEYFPHDHARSRAYRWTEDGILGICDNHQYLCFAFAFWNGKDPILKERLFGLTGNQGNHGEDVKEIYYYIESTPTHSYMKGLYKYPQKAYPYADLVDVTAKRTRKDPEYELEDTGVFAENRYFDIYVEYAKNDVDDIFIRLRALNRGPEKAPLTILPTLWFRDTWTWGDENSPMPVLCGSTDGSIRARQFHLGDFNLDFEGSPQLLFTGNETNIERLYGTVGDNRYYKDAFHEYIIGKHKDVVNPLETGTKSCGVYQVELEPNQQSIIHLRLSRDGSPPISWEACDKIFDARIADNSDFILCSQTGWMKKPGMCSARPLPACSGANSITTLSSTNGSTETRRCRNRPNSASTDAIPRGVIFSTKTSFPCRTNGNIRGMRPGIWPSIRLPLRSGRSGFRQAPARAFSARMVHASQRADSGL